MQVILDLTLADLESQHCPIELSAISQHSYFSLANATAIGLMWLLCTQSLQV